MRKTLVILAGLALALLSVTACSGGSSGQGSGPRTVDITITGSSVTPNGERVDVSVGDPVTLRIHADRAGELHVHSTPERHIDFPKGTSTRTVTIDKPGVVDIEDHALEKTIVQLQVS